MRGDAEAGLSGRLASPAREKPLLHALPSNSATMWGKRKIKT